MSALDRHLYGNPETILIQRQQHEINRKSGMERVCSGCIHKRVIFVGEVKHKACALKRGSPSIWCDFKEVEKA